MKHTEMCVVTYIITNTTLPSKAKCSVFIYSLFAKIMYITANKVMFIVTEVIKPIIRNSKNSTINTTSLSHSKSYVVKWQHTSAFQFHFLHRIIQYN